MDAKQLRKLLDEARKSLDVPDLTAITTLPVTKVRQILRLLRQADNAGKAKGEPMDAVQLRRLLDDVLRSLKDPDLIAAANVQAGFFSGTIADEMRRVTDGLEKGLRMKPPGKQHLKEALSCLLNELKPYSGVRKCRPYELFLFAAQNRLQEEKLVRKLPGFIPNPPYCPLSLSILESHNGVDIAMGIEDPG